MLALHENALVAGLKNHRDMKDKVRTFDSLPDVLTDKVLARYAADAPALYVVPGRITVKDDDATLEFTVVGIVRNVAGQAQARKGDGKDIGCDHLLILATRAINQQRHGNCRWFLTTAEMADDDLFLQAGIAAIEMKFVSSPVPLDADFGADQLAELDDFNTFHADLDIAPEAGPAEHARWLATPPDYSTSSPDAQLDVTLNT